MAATVKQKLRRRLQSLAEKVERIIQQAAVDGTRQLSLEEILGDAWMFEEADTGMFFAEPEYWRVPPSSRLVH